RGSAEGRGIRARDSRRRRRRPARTGDRCRCGAPQPGGAPADAGRYDRSAHGRRAHRSHCRRTRAARHARAAGRPAAAGPGQGAGVIRTNLSTRPFYNERSVQMLLLLVALIVVAFTAFNVSRVLRYSRSDTRLATQAARDEARAADLRQQAVRLRATVDTKQIDFASTDAREANDLIDRRTFSWTDLFNRFEATLPDDVLITTVRPSIQNEGFGLRIGVIARPLDDINMFLETLDATGAFKTTFSAEEHIDEQNQLNAPLESIYLPEVGHATGNRRVTRPQR